MKALKTVLLSLVFLLFLAIIIAFLFISSGLDMKRQPVINGVDASSLSDGTYNGYYKGGRWTNDIAVTITGGKITDITIIDDVTFAKQETSDALFQRVIEKQTTAVDAVSGATVTSKAYLKAIENALNADPA